MNKLVAALTCAVLLGTGAASAATLTFNFDEATTGWQRSLGYSEGGVDLSVTGMSTDGRNALVATWYGAGLGVHSQGDHQHTIDSIGRDDAVVLRFSEEVTVTAMAFSYVSHGSVFDFFVDGTRVIDNGGVAANVSFTPGYTSDLFALAADSSTSRTCLSWFCWNSTTESQFKLRSVTVVTADPSVVPLPAAGWGLLVGLGALAAVRRRKSV